MPSKLRVTVSNRCPRCCGLIVNERISAGDCCDAYGLAWWRCVNCGFRLDFRIAKNRLLMGHSS